MASDYISKENFKDQSFQYRIDQRILKIIKALKQEDLKKDLDVYSEENPEYNEENFPDTSYEHHLKELFKSVVIELNDIITKLIETIKTIKENKPVTAITRKNYNAKIKIYKDRLCYDTKPGSTNDNDIIFVYMDLNIPTIDNALKAQKDNYSESKD